MKILLLRSNPRASGFTAQLLDLLVGSARTEGATVEEVDLTASDIHPCRGCFKCWTETPGTCVQKDDMQELLEKMLTCDLLLCATPLYAYTIGAYLKIFLERTFPLLSPGIAENAEGIDVNRVRFPQRMPRAMAVMIVGGLRSTMHADGAVSSLRRYAEGLGMKFLGALVRLESSFLSFTDAKPKSIRLIESAMVEAGRVLARGEPIGDDILRKASIHLCPDLKTFTAYSEIYWEHALRETSSGGTLESAVASVNSDIRIIMQEMARNADTSVARAGQTFVFQFDFPDKELHYTLELSPGGCTLSEGHGESADLRITCSSATWVAIAMRRADPLKALAARLLTVEGDTTLFRRLGRYFPPPGT